MSWRKHFKLRRWLAVSAVVLIALVVVLFTCDEALLCARSEIRSADVIVVLGGEPVVRAEHAAKLATNGLAPRVIVSGHGDCESNRRVLVARGVAAKRIQVECASRSTQENALETVKLLRAQKCRRVIIVTSWFHSRRALSSFRKYAPEIEFLSAPVPRTKPWKFERNYIASEYLKTAGYAVRYGIWPVGE
jgi:uncharacterized SAM-binding protein YcdF (DUF218 family)